MMIIKEILMLMLLLQFSNGIWGFGGVVETVKEKGAAFVEAAIKCARVAGEGEIDNICTGGRDIIKREWCNKVYSKICISSNHNDIDIKKHPGKYLEPIAETKINVIMDGVKIISINEHGLIIGFELEVKWLDNRLKIWHLKTDEPFDLTKGEYTKDLFWVPHLNYGTGFVLDTDKLRKMSLSNKNGTVVSQIFYVTTSMECKMDNILHFPFDHHNCTLEFDDQSNETKVEAINMIHPRMSIDNIYDIKAIKEYSLKDQTGFGIKITFVRNAETRNGILINYHLMCGMIVMVSAINFLVDPKIVPGRAGLLVTLFLVLTNFFGKAQDEAKGFTALTIYILTCMIFIATGMLYYGLLLFKLRKILKIKDQKMESSSVGNEIQTSNSVIKLDRLMLVFYVLTFIIFNVYYFIKYLI